MTRRSKSILIVLIFNALLLTGSICLGLHKGDMDRYFREGETVTFFSTLFLAMTSFTAFFCSNIHRRLDKTPLLNFWSISCAGFFYLMLDENFMIHEGMDRAILRSLGRPENAYNFDGWILGAMGCIGLILIWRNRKELMRYKDFTFFLGLAFFFFGGMVIADQLEILSETFKVVDDSFKIIGVSFFLAAYINAFLSCIDRLLPQRA